MRLAECEWIPMSARTRNYCVIRAESLMTTEIWSLFHILIRTVKLGFFAVWYPAFPPPFYHVASFLCILLQGNQIVPFRLFNLQVASSRKAPIYRVAERQFSQGRSRFETKRDHIIGPWRG